MRTFVFSALSLLLLALPATAQSSTNMSVQLNVTTAPSIGASGAVNFGTLYGVLPATGTVSVNPVSPVAGTSTGTFTISGIAGATVSVTFPSSIALTHSASSGMPTVTFTAAMTSHPTTQSSSTPFASSGTVVIPATGSHRLWLGGTAGWIETLPTGSYTGSFPVTVTYQ